MKGDTYLAASNYFSNHQVLYSTMSFKRPGRWENSDYPLFRANEVKCDLVVLPSLGTFLDNYVNGAGLHIAIVDDQGWILEFDRNGMYYGSVDKEVRWQQCLRLNFSNHLLSIFQPLGLKEIQSTWTRVVEFFCSIERSNWSKAEYECEQKNCFDFVLAFLTKLINELELKAKPNAIIDNSLERLKVGVENKISFCEHFVVPETKKLIEYIVSHRKMKLNVRDT